MAKQIEAGALVTHLVLKSLAKRLNLSDTEAQEIIARVIASVEDDVFPA